MLRLLLICFFFDKTILRTQVHSSALASILSLYVSESGYSVEQQWCHRTELQKSFEGSCRSYSLKPVDLLRFCFCFYVTRKNSTRKGPFQSCLFWYPLPVLIWVQRYLHLKNGSKTLSSPGDCYTVIILVLDFDLHCTGTITGEQVWGTDMDLPVMTGWGIFVNFLK